jgi:hypothetical protein
MKTLEAPAARKMDPPRPKRMVSVGKYLNHTEVPPDKSERTKPLTPHMKKVVRGHYRQLAKSAGLEVYGPVRVRPNHFSGRISTNASGLAPLNDALRGVLAEAIFVVEDEIESRGDGQPRHPVVETLNAIRNRIYDEIGVNEW